MKRQTASSEELVCKINYVRDWLDKAEDAVKNGDNLTAVSKLVLAKADTSVLLSMLVPVQAQAERKMPLLSPSMLRKLATVAAPLVLAAIFFLGLSMGADKLPDTDQPVLNQAPAVALHRSVDRPTMDNLLFASFKVSERDTVVDEPTPETVKETPVILADTKPVRRNSKPVAPKPEPVVVVDESPETPIVASEPVTPEPEDPPLDIFGFSMDVIRSARENAGR